MYYGQGQYPQPGGARPPMPYPQPGQLGGPRRQVGQGYYPPPPMPGMPPMYGQFPPQFQGQYPQQQQPLRNARPGPPPSGQAPAGLNRPMAGQQVNGAPAAARAPTTGAPVPAGAPRPVIPGGPVSGQPPRGPPVTGATRPGGYKLNSGVRNVEEAPTGTGLTAAVLANAAPQEQKQVSFRYVFLLLNRIFELNFFLFLFFLFFSYSVKSFTPRSLSLNPI